MLKIPDASTPCKWYKSKNARRPKGHLTTLLRSMTTKHLSHIPTNLITGFLGVGKTTAILNLLEQKPNNENWAVLVNEFGKIGLDGVFYSATGIAVKEIVGGCLCCAVNVPFQVSINNLLKEATPDRLLIEPSGLGHPKQVLEMLSSDLFKEVLDLKASICLVDPRKLTDPRYAQHQTFRDQIALSDVLIANKTDMADHNAIELFHQWGKKASPPKERIAQTTQGQLDASWLNLPRNPQRQTSFTHTNKSTFLHPTENDPNTLTNHADGYQSFGQQFPARHCFDFEQLQTQLSQLNAERIKGLLNTNQGWFIVNGSDGQINYLRCSASSIQSIEVILREDLALNISTTLNACRTENQ